MSAIDDFLASQTEQSQPSSKSSSNTSSVDSFLSGYQAPSDLFQYKQPEPKAGVSMITNPFDFPVSRGPVVPTLGLPGSSPMLLSDVSKSLPNVTDVLSGPRLSTIQAIQRGEQPNVTPNPVQTSQQTAYRDQLLSDNAAIKARDQAQEANRQFSHEHVAARLNQDLTNANAIMGILFAPVTGAIEAAKNIKLTPENEAPGMFEVPKAGLKYGAEAISGVVDKSTSLANSYINKQLDAVPQDTPEQKALVEEWRPILTQGASLISMLTAGEALHGAIKAPGDILRTVDGVLDQNGVVASAKSVLGISPETDMLGRQKVVDPEEVKKAYRSAAHATHPDAGGSAEAFDVVNQAKSVLEDHANLSREAFNAKYQAMLQGARTIVHLLPDQTGQPPTAPTSALDQVLEQKQQAATHAEQLFTPELKKEPVLAGTGDAKSNPNVVYHGTKAPITSISEANALQYGNPASLYGPGLYVTDNPDVAKGYSETKGSGPTGKILMGTIKPDVKLLDLDDKLPVESEKALRDVATQNDLPLSESSPEQNGQMLMKEFMHSLNGLPKQDATEIIDALHYRLEQQGYDGFKHTGGQVTGGVPSNVSILWDTGTKSLRDKIDPIDTSLSSSVEPIKTEKNVGAKKQSGVARSIEAKAIENGLTKAFEGTAQYTPVTIKDQVKRVTDLMGSDMQLAKDAVLGKRPLPDGLLAGTLIKAMEDHAMRTSDAQLALDIANSPLTSETSIHAQEMRMLAEREPDSAVANLQKLKSIKEEAANKRIAYKKEDVVKDIQKSIRKQKSKVTKETWSSFIDSITC